jgi:hypothetical protein
MISHVLKTRMLPVFIVFLCCILPYTVQMSGGTLREAQNAH